MHTHGQVSIESLLLWTCLAGILAAMIPVFSGAMNAYQTLNEVNQFNIFANEMRETIHFLTFSSPGSQWKMEKPQNEKISIEVEGKNIILKYENETLSQPKEKIIHSPWEVEIKEGNEKEVFLRREENKLILVK